MEQKSKQLVIIDSAYRALIEAKDLDDIKSIRDKAEAVRQYAQSARLGEEVQIAAAELKLHAERKAGEIILGMKLWGGDRRSSHPKKSVLEEIGINKNQSVRWQLEAQVSEEKFKQYLIESREKKRGPTSVGLLRIARLECKLGHEPTSESDQPPFITQDFQKLVDRNYFYSCIYVNLGYDSKFDKRKASQLDLLSRLDIKRISGENAHLHVKTTNEALCYGLEFIKKSGFKYRSSLVFLRNAETFGHYWREAHEFLLLGVRGSLDFKDNSMVSFVEIDTEQQSESILLSKKSVYEIIEKVSPGPYLELFGDNTKNPPDGWTLVYLSGD